MPRCLPSPSAEYTDTSGGRLAELGDHVTHGTPPSAEYTDTSGGRLAELGDHVTNGTASVPENLGGQ